MLGIFGRSGLEISSSDNIVLVVMEVKFPVSVANMGPLVCLSL